MSYIILLLILLIILLIIYYKFDKDILSPSFISCSMFSFCVILAILGVLSWNSEKNLSLTTILVVVMGVVAFCFGEFISRLANKNKRNEKKKIKELKIIKIEKWKIVVTIIGIFITALLMFFEIKRICAYYGFTSCSIPKLLSFYRTKTILFSTDLIDDGVDINFLVKQMRKVCEVACIIFMYVVANNILAKDKLKNIIIYTIPIVMSLFLTLLNSSRSMMMHLLVGFLMLFLLMLRYKNKKISTKNCLCLGGVLFGSLLLFYLIAPLLGRGNNTNFFKYITFYLGTSLPSFNHFLTHMPVHPPYFGFETFSGIYTTLNKLNIVDALQIGSREWVSFNGLSSNVYMSFRRYFFDFGFIGVLLCQFVFGFVASKIYLKIKDLKHPFLLIVYGYYSYMLIDQIRDEQFFGAIGSTMIAYLILMGILYFIYFKLKLVFPKKEIGEIK